MKKVIILVLVVVLAAYTMYQNQGRFFLILLAQHRLSNPFSSLPSANSVSGKPPTYKDGSYTGSVANAFYGNIQVKAVISGGKLTDVQFLQYPNDQLRSTAINTMAMPNLKQEAIQSQTANVDVVSGATDSSQAFVQSLQSALDQAKS